jgi:hypothetical protein
VAVAAYRLSWGGRQRFPSPERGDDCLTRRPRREQAAGNGADLTANRPFLPVPVGPAALRVLSLGRASLLHMKIASAEADRYWIDIAAHTGTRENGAPWPLQVQVAALVGNENIEASTTTFSGDTPSSWAVKIITAGGRLVSVSMQFDAEQYDVERDRVVSLDNPVPATVTESSARPLGDVVRLDIGKARMRPATMGRTMPDQLDVGDVSLTFRDGAVTNLGFDQVEMTVYDDRGRSDAFMDALRKHTEL